MILEFLNNNVDNTTDEELLSLKNDGYVLLKRGQEFWKKYNVDLNTIRNRCDELINLEGKKAGKDGKKYSDILAEEGANRLTNLLSKGNCFKNLIAIPDILKCIYSVLGMKFRLSSLDMREPLKNKGHQGLHLDWGQRESLDSEFFQCSAFILLDKITINNGPLRVIPKSHRDLVNIKSSSGYSLKRSKKDDLLLNYEDKTNAQKITGNIGDIVILNSNTFHGGTNNIIGDRRRVIFLNYRNKSLRTQLNQYDYIPKNLHNRFNKFEKYLIDLYPTPIIDRIKRWVYDNRKHKFVHIFVRFYIFIKKLFIN